MRFMRMITLAAASIFAMTSVQAATFMSPSTKTTADSVIEQIAKKKVAKKAAKAKPAKAAKPAKKAEKKVAAKPGKCGAYKYYNKKTKACADKR